MLRLAVVFTVAAVAASTGKAVLTMPASPPDIPQSYIFTPPGKFARLKAGTTYGASQFHSG
jgi:hypothetical protein